MSGKWKVGVLERDRVWWFTGRVCADEAMTQVQELELSKGKATELLKKYEGERERAIRAFVVGEVVG